MPKYIGQRKRVIFEDFEIEAAGPNAAMDKLKDGFLLGEPCRTTEAEEYSGFTIWADEDEPK